jgi:filamentous hemagglutinin family protein
MTKTHFWLYFLTLSGLIFSTKNAIAQTTYQPSDRPPVADNTQIGTNVSSGDGKNFDITGGLNRGQTLFHSFQDFSVPTNGAANFANPAGIRDIISRVTGGSFSDINGRINSNGANFFLINPNGIVFGPNAQLNVGRAFMASTANGINLFDGAGRAITFGTNPNGDAPLLTISPNVFFNVSSLNMGGGNGAISNFGTLQTPNNSQYIGLIGGNVTLDGSGGGGKIVAPGGRVDIGGLSGAGTVSVDNNGLVFSSGGIRRSNVLLTDDAGITVRAMNTSNLDTVQTFFNNATSNGSSINISANNLDLLNSGKISNTLPAAIDAGLDVNSGVQTKAAGNINIDATGKVTINNSAIKNTLRPGSEGSIGGIKIQAGTLDLNNNSMVSTAIGGKGTAGDVIVTAKDAVSLVGKIGIYSGIYSEVLPGGVGNGGTINIKTGSLSITNGAQLSASTYGTGNAGNVTVMARDTVSFADQSYIFSTVEEGAVGKGGGVEISTQNLLVTNGANVSASTNGKGSAGSVKITARGHVSLDGKKDGVNSGVFSTVEQGGVGKGGGVEITADNLSVTNFATVTTSSKGQGDGGDIFLNANKIVLNNPNNAVVDINNGGIISIALSSTGGDIKVIAKDYLLLRDNSLIATNSFSTGKDGNGGNITISSPLIIATPVNNDITANAVQGKGGNVKIFSNGLFGIQKREKRQESPLTNDITASSDFNQQGRIDVSTPGTDPGKDSTALPNVPTDASNQISQACSASNRQNKFTVAGRGGMPPNANDPLTSDVVWQDPRATNTQPAANNTTNNPPKYPPPAVGLVFDGKGKAMLVAAATEGQPTGTNVTCPQAREQFRIRDQAREDFRIRD